MDAIFDLNRASNFDQFRAAIGRLGAPSQNLVYADVEGNIGYQLAGAVPRRGKGDGRTLSPGWDTGYDWRGLHPVRSELPYAYNPAKRLHRGRQPADDRRRLSGPARLGLLLRLAQPGDHRTG